jgi:heat shock protein HtpX
VSEALDLFSQQAANRRRSQLVVVLFVLFFMWLGFGGDYIAYLYTRSATPNEYHHVFPWLGVLLTVVAAAMARSAWRNGPDRVIWASGAEELLVAQTDEERLLINCVEEMAIAAGLPRPRIYLVPDDDPNAFATGHDERDARIAVTRGMLTTCNRDELQAVIGHELGHIKNHDVSLMTLLAGLIGAIMLVSDGTTRMLRMGNGRSFGGGGGGGSKKRGDAGPLAAILLAVWVISWLLAPLLTRLLATGVSRGREYLADSMSAQFTRNPLALASALEKIGAASAPTKSIKQSCAHLCIEDPLGRSVNSREGRIADFFGTHPPLSMRVARLRAMGYQEMKARGTFVPAAS